MKPLLTQAAARAALPAPRLIGGLVLRRYGPLPLLAAVLLVLGLSAWAWLLPRHAALARSAQRLAAVAEPAERQATPPTAQASASAPADLRQALLDPKAINDVVRAVLAQAQRQGVSIGKVEYRWGTARAGQAPMRVQLGLPLRGEYPAIKQFLATVLLGLPAAAIDQISLKRTGTGTGTGTNTSAGAISGENAGGLEGMVWLSLWQRSLLDPAPELGAHNAPASDDGADT